MTTEMLIAGLACYVGFLITVRWREGIWLAPTTLFVTFFFLATFVSPYTDIQNDNLHEYNLQTLPTATLYSLACTVALWLGYVLATHRRRRVKSVPPPPLPPLLDGRGLTVVRFLVPVLILVQCVVILKGGYFESGKGANNYYALGPLWTAIELFCTMQFPLLLALCMIAFSRGPSAGAADRYYLLALLGAVLLTSLLLFSRQIFLWAGLYLMMFYHTRQGLTRRHLGIICSLVVALSVFSSLRNYGTGMAQLSLDEAADTLSEYGTNFDKALSYLGGSVAGQTVFTNVLEYVPDYEGYRYGGTYLESAAGLLLPRFLTGQYSEEAIDTPAFWYKRWYAPHVEGHGFDFSLLAEAYMNFGPCMVLAFLPLGALLGRLSQSIYWSTSPFVVFSSIVIITALCFGIRNDSNAMFKSIGYFTLFMWGLRRLAGRQTAASSRNAPSPLRRPGPLVPT